MYGRSSSSKSNMGRMGPGEETMFTMRAGLEPGVEARDVDAWVYIWRETGVLGSLMSEAFKSEVTLDELREGVSGALILAWYEP